MASKTTIANRVGWGIILGGILLTGYHGCRSQSVVFERDIFGNISSARLQQLGREEKLVPDSQNPNRLIVKGNPTLNQICDGIGYGARWIYDGCQNLRNQIYPDNTQGQSQQKNYSQKKIN